MIRKAVFYLTKMALLCKLIWLVLNRKSFFGFIQGHAYLSSNDLAQLRSLVGISKTDVVREFEERFSTLIGDGRTVSFAAGRMAFYALMKIMNIGSGDEVVLHGATCSVMVNAVLRAGATPVFSDIDPNTFGSSACHIEKCITSYTRMIVAQHSFGIPCDIRPVVELAHSRGIFVLEDSALALASKIDGIAVGNFGDAALFSTDHSKPLNTLSGGLIYSRNADLINKLLEVQAGTQDLSDEKQQALWRRVLLEKRYCKPSMYAYIRLIDIFTFAISKLVKWPQPFLDEDFRAVPSSSYSYPARMPSFLAAIGIFEVNRWEQVMNERIEIFRALLDTACHSVVQQYIPSVYFDKRREIVPLRFVWTQLDGALIRKKLDAFLDTASTWFLKPIIVTHDPLEKFGYYEGRCPISERVGPGMVNLPCNLSKDDSTKMIELFRAAISPSIDIFPPRKKQASEL